MARNIHVSDYEPVRPSGGGWSAGNQVIDSSLDWPKSGFESNRSDPKEQPAKQPAGPAQVASPRQTILKRCHTLSYWGLFLFTFIVYFRPYEVFPSLSWLEGSAAWIAIGTLIVFLPTQFLVEGRMTARPREVNLVLLLCLLAFLSVPLATDPHEAWTVFSSQFVKVVLIFIVLVNVTRTRFRLSALLLLALVISSYMSIAAINDYRMGRLEAQGVRIAGNQTGMLQNPNDIALHLVTLIPIALALALGSRGVRKIVYGATGVLMLAAIVVTFSRGGFIGLMAAMVVMALRLRHTHKNQVMILGSLLVFFLFTLAPGSYGTRILSSLNPASDPTGSATQRKELLIRSFIVSLRHPLLGVGMSNFHIYSDNELVSHNSYTQVSAEMGLTAALVYTMFIVGPLQRMRRIQKETMAARRRPKSYYLAVGLEASLIGYMFASFFVSVAYLWYIYYLVGYAVCVQRLHAAEAGVTNQTDLEGYRQSGLPGPRLQSQVYHYSRQPRSL